MTDYTPVTDNTLLPFGDAQIPRGDENTSDEISITEIFEDGFLFGSETFDSFWVSTNGGVNFVGPWGSWAYDPYNIAPLSTDLDSRNPPDPTSGVFVDLNTERDSVVVTWNLIGRYFEDYSNPYTFQMELLDLGDGDAEVIFRYADMGEAGASWYNAGLTAEWGSSIVFEHWESGIPAYELDDTPGNTGIAGVWQYRIVDGVLEPGLIEDGTPEADLMIGTARGDVLNGLGGNDTIQGNDGADVLSGGNGNDEIDGGLSQDTITGGAGADTITGGGGNDQISGQDGNDTIDGGAGRDTIYGGVGDDLLAESWEIRDYWESFDRIESGEGNDTVQGAYGNDTIDGGDGNDELRGGHDQDEMHGGAGNDTMAGGSGNDSLYGGDGDDFLYGDIGFNTTEGGAGADTFLLDPMGVLTIVDYNPGEGDRLIVDGDLYARNSFFARAGGAGEIYDADGNRTSSALDILYRAEGEPDLRLIATVTLLSGVDAVELALPSDLNPGLAPIIWDFF